MFVKQCPRATLYYNSPLFVEQYPAQPLRDSIVKILCLIFVTRTTGELHSMPTFREYFRESFENLLCSLTADAKSLPFRDREDVRNLFAKTSMSTTQSSRRWLQERTILLSLAHFTKPATQRPECRRKPASTQLRICTTAQTGTSPDY